MRYYVDIDTTSGNVESRIFWPDDRDLPANYPVPQGHQLITLLDDAGANLDVFTSCYNPTTQTFGPKLTVASDVTQISHVNGVANITVTYPSATVNETCNFSIDGQAVTLNVVNGVATTTFTNQVVGWHTIIVSSTTHYGKALLSIEVV